MILAMRSSSSERGAKLIYLSLVSLCLRGSLPTRANPNPRSPPRHEDTKSFLAPSCVCVFVVPFHQVPTRTFAYHQDTRSPSLSQGPSCLCALVVLCSLVSVSPPQPA